jgi:hypothetical protein
MILPKFYNDTDNYLSQIIVFDCNDKPDASIRYTVAVSIKKPIHNVKDDARLTQIVDRAPTWPKPAGNCISYILE